MHIKEERLPIFSFEQTRLTRCLQQSWPDVTNNHDSASPITMTRRRQQLWPGAINIYKPDILAMINRQVLQAGWKSDEFFQDQYFLSRRFGSRFKWIISYNISLQETNASKLTLKLAYWPGFLKRSIWIFCIHKVWTYLLKEICYEFMGMYQEGNDKDLKMIRCRFTRIFNPEHNLSKLFWCLFCRISLTWINPN